jgi:hypothetical protein
MLIIRDARIHHATASPAVNLTRHSRNQTGLGSPKFFKSASNPHGYRTRKHPRKIFCQQKAEFHHKGTTLFADWGVEKVALRAAWVGSIDFAVLPLYTISCGIVPFFY